MKKVFFYCQHLLGIGHVTRSLSIVNELALEFDVTYVQGGPPVPLKPLPSVRVVQLDPLLMREADSSLYDPNGARSPEEIFARRALVLEELAAEGFDAGVIELYPFGRKKFGPEVQALLKAARAKNSEFRAACSVRDILVEKNDSAKRNQKIAATVREFFQAVWVHSDPNLILFSDTFSETSLIADRLSYTGFVAEPTKPAAAMRAPKIVLSLGGGSVGEELFRAAAKTVAHFNDFQFLFVSGPYTPPALLEDLKRELAPYGSRVAFSGLLPNFEQVLAESRLSLSMAGYNTVMNLLNTRTPGLVLTYDANGEQLMRASLLESRGYLGVLRPEDLSPERLQARMEAALSSSYPAALPDLKGALNSRLAMRALLSEK
ncbi:MAG: hypothetical protein EOP11_08410 [Proteobacteria bacterium]|nr:MAG: hypothetical protein EOP11_08410 [Pseudomonadota bacterium]